MGSDLSKKWLFICNPFPNFWIIQLYIFYSNDPKGGGEGGGVLLWKLLFCDKKFSV